MTGSESDQEPQANQGYPEPDIAVEAMMSILNNGAHDGDKDECQNE